MDVKVKDLEKKYDNRLVVKGVNLNIKPGQILGLLGPNGAGKSTTIKMLTGQIKPTSGKIVIDGKEYDSVPQEFRGNIGVMPQELIIWDDLNILENLLFSANLQGMSRSKAKLRADELIKGLDLEKELKTLARNLSGGYQRRLNLAISIIHEPSLIFLDEPTPGIDPQSRRFLMDYIERLKKSGEYSIVLTDHYLDEAEKLSDYVVILDNGEIIAEGTVPQLKRKYGDGNLLEIELPEEITKNKDIMENLELKLNQNFTETIKTNNMISTIVENPAEALNISIDILKELDIKASHIGVKEPTLEDIFLILTGKEVR